MSDLIKNVFIVFFTINAIFWSLFSHETHCKFASNFTNECPPHSFHITFGIISFFIALIIAQYNWVRYNSNL